MEQPDLDSGPVYPKIKGVGLISRTRWPQFAADARVLTDRELAKKYGIGERSATNWRIRAVGRKQ